MRKGNLDPVVFRTSHLFSKSFLPHKFFFLTPVIPFHSQTRYFIYQQKNQKSFTQSRQKSSFFNQMENNSEINSPENSKQSFSKKEKEKQKQVYYKPVLKEEWKEISYENKEYFLVKEGEAKILFPKENEVFYNPVQEVNRDLSILMIGLFREQLLEERKKSSMEALKKKKKIKDNEEKPLCLDPERGMNILEALSATGLRSIRYFKEIPGINKIVVNDLDKSAVETIRRNIKYNELDENKLIPNHSDATEFMYLNRNEEKRFDVVDIDPYGGANIFLDGAVQCVEEGGLLCITCTDLAVLCGNHAEACWSKYNSVSINKKYNHEMALRIVLQSVEMHANRYKRYIVPIGSFFIDFYVRIFVRVYTSPSQVKFSATKMSQVYQCIGCESYWIQPLMKYKDNKFNASILNIPSTKCTHCDKQLRIGGPIWSEPIHNKEWIQQLINVLERDKEKYGQYKKIKGLLTVVLHELHQIPLFCDLPSLSSVLHISTPPMLKFRSALTRLGYEVSNSHCNPNAIKTNASFEVIWDIMRCWEKSNPSKQKVLTSSGGVILSKTPSIEANFEIDEKALQPEKEVPKFIPNLPHWGPGTRAGAKKSFKKVKVRKLHPQDLTQLKAAILLSWRELPKILAQNLIDSMPARINKLIQAQGDSI